MYVSDSCLLYGLFAMVLDIVEGTHHIDEGTSPIGSELLAATPEGIVHGMVEPEAVDTYEILQRLVDVRQTFGNVLLDRCIAESHVIKEYLEIIVVGTQLNGYQATEMFVIGLCDEGLGLDVVEGFAIGKQGCFQIKQRKELETAVDKLIGLHFGSTFQKTAKLGGYGNELDSVCIENWLI